MAWNGLELVGFDCMHPNLENELVDPPVMPLLWIVLGLMGLHRAGLSWIGLGWTGLHWVVLDCDGLGWVRVD